jgi:hypothetical protein
MPSLEARALIEKVIDEQSQQVWRAASFVIQGFKEKMIKANIETIVPMLDGLVAYDAQSTSGLSLQADATLALAKAALAAQMERDSAEGLLNEERIGDLMGRGPGLYIVGQAVLAPVQQAFGG